MTSTLPPRSPARAAVGVDSPVRGAALVTLCYLLGTFPLLWRGPWGWRHTAVVLAHLVAILALWWSLRVRRPAAQSREPRAESILADWLPLVLVPFLYAELPHLMGAGVGYHDAIVQHWEASMFGTQPARTLAGALPYGALSELVHLGYILFYPIVYVPPFLLYIARRQTEFGRTVFAVMATYVVCFVVFVAFPVEGPRYAWPAPPGVPGGPIRWVTLAILERGSSRGTAFPSSHAAVAVAQAVAALRYQRRVGVAVAVTSALLIVGAVYGGFHYAVDMAVGAVVGLAVSLAVAARLTRG